MLDHLIMATDGSDCADRAAAVGAALADACGASVDVVHVRAPDRRPDGDVERRERELLDAAARPAADADLAVETHVLEGRPAKRLVEFAGDRGADLLVVGRRGRSGLGQHLLGSTTERVLRTAAVPVLTVAAGDGTVALDDVLLTTDGSDAAGRAVPHATAVADRCGATLHVLSAVDVQAAAGAFDAGGVDSAFVERLETRATDAVERAADAVADESASVSVETAVVRGTPHEAVREYVADAGVDLVVISSEGQSNFTGQRLGSVAGRVLRTVGVPVLVVPVRD